MDNPDSTTRRLSLTKSQIQTGAGAELLALCQSITEDGSLSDQEVDALRQWLRENGSADLPSIEFLTTIVGRIISDGRVTKDERKELYKALEAVLPPEVRKLAAVQRRLTEAEEREQDRVERAARKEAEKEKRERERPVASANFMVAGVRYEGRPEVIRRHVRERDQVFMVRDPNNKYSRNAIEIRTAQGYQIGFAPEDDAVELAPLLDKGYPHNAIITKVLAGGATPIPVVQAYVFRPESEMPGAVPREGIPAKRERATAFPALAILGAVVVFVIIAYVAC